MMDPALLALDVARSRTYVSTPCRSLAIGLGMRVAVVIAAPAREIRIEILQTLQGRGDVTMPEVMLDAFHPALQCPPCRTELPRGVARGSRHAVRDLASWVRRDCKRGAKPMGIPGGLACRARWPARSWLVAASVPPPIMATLSPRCLGPACRPRIAPFSAGFLRPDQGRSSVHAACCRKAQAASEASATPGASRR